MINMTREEANKLLPIIQAFCEGKTIQSKGIADDVPLWWNDNNPTFDVGNFDYRIKPEPKYRPFANAQECWNEMQKHQPFGWLKSGELLMYIISIGEGITVHNRISNCGYSFKSAVSLTFADGTPFGILEEE